MSLAAPGASAQESVRLSAVAGFDNRFHPVGWLPISVTVESQHALRGDLEITSRGFGGPSVHVQPVEVPGGGHKRFDFLVPPPTPEGAVEVTLVAGGTAVASSTSRPVVAEDEIMVGVVGDDPTKDAVASGLVGLVVQPTLAHAHTVVLDPQLLELGPRALDILDYVLVDAAALEELPESHIEALSGWSLTGGRLVVAGPTRLPATEESRAIRGGVLAPNGLGEIVTLRGSLREVAGKHALWEAIVRPTPSVGEHGESVFDGFGPSPDASIAGALNEGRAPVGLGWFVAFLLAYLVIVGPLNYLVLKRRDRRELLWVSVPVVALAFSGAAYGLARGTRGGLELKAAGVTFTSGAAWDGRMVATLTSGGGGARSIEFSDAPAKAASLQSFGGASFDATTTNTTDGAAVAFDASPFSIAAASGPLGPAGHIDARLEPAGNGFRGEIVNRSRHVLRDVGVLMAGGAVELGESLQPGEATAVAFEPPHPWVFEPLVRGRLETSLLNELASLLGVVAVAEHPVVFGYADKAPLPAQGVDEVVAEARGMLLLASPVHIEVSSAAVAPFGAGRIDLVDVAGNLYATGNGGFGLERFRHAVFAHRLPPGIGRPDVTGGRLRIAWGGDANLEVYDWHSRAWQSFGQAPGSTPLAAWHFSPAGETYFRFVPRRDPFMDVHRLSVAVELE